MRTLMDQFGSLLPPTTDFQLGYFFFGKQSTKFWFLCQEDLNTINKCIKNVKGSIMLWCDARSTSSAILLLWEQTEKGIRKPVFIKAAANRRGVGHYFERFAIET